MNVEKKRIHYLSSIMSYFLSAETEQKELGFPWTRALNMKIFCPLRGLLHISIVTSKLPSILEWTLQPSFSNIFDFPVHGRYVFATLHPIIFRQKNT